ncbi:MULTISPECIES: hypothetical protein [Photorhabdus]|uniref:Uncharacterized protein n=1 Tax=Photorhabdus bodei TaxID=2029681 RepID=A0AAW6BNE8_9GAMM|nr:MULTISPECIES: hypothetical protein [Photorhabdus]MDB6374957.1 hypothetical protein [Photorhabdus bodei]
MSGDTTCRITGERPRLISETDYRLNGRLMSFSPVATKEVPHSSCGIVFPMGNGFTSRNEMLFL